MGKIISIATQKGGVGKTTTAVSLAGALSFMGKKVLLIDVDPQSNSTSGVGIDKNDIKISSYDIMMGEKEAKDAVVKTKFERLSLIPANMDLSAAEIELATINDRESTLKNSLALIRGNYDYILIDCPPSLGLITTNALNASDTVLIPLECEYFALEGLTQVMNSIRRVKRTFNEKLELEGILFTMYDGRLNLTQEVANEVKKYFPKKIFSTVIPRTVRLAEAPSYGQPICYYDKNGKGALAYNNLAKEILKKN